MKVENIMRSNYRRGSVLSTGKVIFPKAGIRVANTLFVLTVLCSILLGAKQLWAAPTSAVQAEKVVRGWLRVDAEPMGMRLGSNVQRVDTFVDETAQPLYYVVYLEPQGFVILPADDQIEPIIAFVRQGEYDPSLNNPLGALVNSDLGSRVPAAQQLTAERKRGTPGKALNPIEALRRRRADESQVRWRFLKDKAKVVENDSPEGGLDEQFTDISDVRVSPLLQSEWSQGDVGGAPCYNYYTPNNYVCGCVATAMAQLMRYHEYPIDGIGRHSFMVTIDDEPYMLKTRGGNGVGGPYAWSEMALIPESGVTELQRQAIGALCFDAGVAAHMSYSAEGSGAWMDDALQALLETFGYTNGIHGFNGWENIGEGLIEMVNPNLDGKYPVLFGIEGNMGAHAIVCDGYGYHGTSMYHHLNMGWGGDGDLWYHLPVVLDFEIVRSCTYNVFPSGSGEIISGRVVNMAQEPVADVEITGEVLDCDPYDPCTVCIFTATTDSNGIYALLKVPSDANFVITAEKEGFYFDSQDTTTGLSEDMEPVAGNVWGVDFVSQLSPDHDECEQAIQLQLDIPSYHTSFGAAGDSHSSCSDGTDNRDVWHSFTPQFSGYFQFSLCNSTFDTTLAVYDNCNELTRVELGCNDNSELCGSQSELVLPLNAGETCYIRVAGVDAATGAYVITITETSPPEYNDDCENAISLVDGIPFEGNTDDATETMIGGYPLTSSCCYLDELDVWHSYTPTQDCDNVAITLCDSQLENTSLSVYDSCGGTELACNDDSDQCGIGSLKSYLTMPMQAGVTYYIRVAGFNRTTGAYTIKVIGGSGEMLGILPPYEFTWPYGKPIQDCCCLEAIGGEEPHHSWQANQIMDCYDYQTEAGSFSSNGTGNGWHGDDVMWPFTLPFPFNFYCTEYTSVNVCSNGFLDFVETLTHNNNSTQKLLDNVIIAPLWDDLNTSIGVDSDIYIYQAGPNEVTFRWQAVTWQDETPCHFSVTLYEDSRIRFDYGSGNTNLTPTVGISAGNNINYLIISGHDGAETLTNADSVAITFNQSGPALPPGVSLDPNTGCFTGAPQHLGDYNATVEVTDSSDPQVTAHEDFVFHVTVPNDPDLNGDGYVNLLDFAIISTQWLADNCDYPTDWCDKADINMNHNVDMVDLIVMIENWLGNE